MTNDMFEYMDGNGTSYFMFPPCPVPPLIGQVWFKFNQVQVSFLKPGIGFGIVMPRSDYI